MTETRTGYSTLQIAIHWIMAFLIFGAFFTHDGMGNALDRRIEQDLSGLDGATLHTMLGGAAFAFVIVRLFVRLRRGAPEPHGQPLLQTAAKLGHMLLYALMLAAPALGAIAWYGKAEAVGEIHEIIGKALMIVAVGHLLMAILHQALWSDGTLMRMFQPEKE